MAQEVRETDLPGIWSHGDVRSGISDAHGEEAPPGSAGRVTPLQKVKLVDPDALEPVPPREPGELLSPLTTW